MTSPKNHVGCSFVCLCPNDCAQNCYQVYLLISHLRILQSCPKLFSVIPVNPTRQSEWTIKITGSKVTMAELSQLGATGESLVEDSLGEEVSFTLFGTDMAINDLTPTREICGKNWKAKKSFKSSDIVLAGIWEWCKYCGGEQDWRRKVDGGGACRCCGWCCHRYHHRWHETWHGWQVGSFEYKSLDPAFCRETPVTDEEKAGAAWAVAVMWSGAYQAFRNRWTPFILASLKPWNRVR